MYSINSIQNYDELPNFNPNENVLELMREITKAFKYDYDCTIKIKAITDFRRLRKFHKEYFLVTFDNIHNRLFDKTLNNQYEKNEFLLYYIIYFMNEIIIYNSTEMPSEWVEDIFYSIEKYVFNPIEKLKNISREALQNIATEIQCTEKVKCFFKKLEHCDNESAKYYYNLLHLFVENTEEICLINMYEWNLIINDIKNNKDICNYNLAFKALIKEIKNHLDKCNYFEDFTKTLTQENKKFVIESLK